MIIVSQDKMKVVNFENIQNIWISVDGEGRFTIEATATTNSTLGHYKTKEKAKGVLQEIIRKAEDLSWANLMDNLQIAIHDKNFGGALSNTYYMPEE